MKKNIIVTIVLFFLFSCIKKTSDLKFIIPLNKNSASGRISISEINRDTNEFGILASFTAQINSQPSSNVKLCLKSSDSFSGGEVQTTSLDTECSNLPSLVFTSSNWQEIQTITIKGSRGEVGKTGNTNYEINFQIITNDSFFSSIQLPSVRIVNKDIDSASEFFVLIQPTGLNSGPLVLNLNSTQSLSINSNSLTSFNSALASGSTYSISITTQPSTLTCAFTNTPFGTITSHTSIRIECIPGYLFNGGIFSTSTPPTLSQSFAGIQTISGSMPPLSFNGFVDGTATTARYDNPIALATDGNFIYIADIFNNSVRRLNISTGIVSTLATVSNPHGISTDGSNVYVTEHFNHQIKRVVISTGAVSVFAGTGVAGDSTGVALSSELNSPTYLTTDGIHIFVTDRGNSKIKKIILATGILSTVASGLNSPNGIATDGEFIYIADTNNHRVIRIRISDNTFTLIAGSGVQGNSNNANGLLAEFNTPYGITIDGSFVYVLEGQGKRFRRILKNSPFSVTTFINQNDGYADGTIGTASFCGAGLNCDSSLTTDGLFLYFADRFNHSIRRIYY